MYGTQYAHIWQLDYVNLICGESGGFRRGKLSATLFHNSNEDVWMAVHGGDSVDSITSTHFSKNTAKDMGTLGFKDSDAKSLLLFNGVFRVGADQTGQ